MSSTRSRSGGMDRRMTLSRKYRSSRNAPIVDLRRQIAVGGGDQPHVDARVRPIGADALNLAGLEEAEQHHLHPHAHLADFVEEHRAVRRHFEQARLVAIRAGEAAADVAEQLRFEQRVGQPGAIDGDERRRRAALRS